MDYSPLITAMIRSTTSVKDAPNTLAIRCRGLRTELRFARKEHGARRAPAKFRSTIKSTTKPSIRLQWTASADGKIASYKDDTVGLLRSLPEGGQLKINVLDGPGPATKRRFNSPD